MDKIKNDGRNKLSDEVNYNFWENWTDTTATEKKAIATTIRARELIIASVPKEALVAIYIKGSFVRREMTEESDIDIVPVVSANNYLKAVWSTNVDEILPAIITPLSVEEFKNNEHATPSDHEYDFRAKPDRFLRFIDDCKLINGEPIDVKQYPIRDDVTMFRNQIETLKLMLPLLKEGRLELDNVVKEVFWTIETGQLAKGLGVVHSFKGITDSIDDPNHIVHLCMELRKDKSKKDEFANKLETYLEKSE